MSIGTFENMFYFRQQCLRQGSERIFDDVVEMRGVVGIDLLQLDQSVHVGSTWDIANQSVEF
eukprot:12059825-Prorocentrum_lima.AAC.1